MLWVRASVTIFRYTDYNTDSMKQIKERTRFIKLSLVGYGNPQTRILDVNYKRIVKLKENLT